MGFWDVTKRMLQGKPAFEVPSTPQKGKTVDEWGDPIHDPDPVDVGDATSDERIHRNQRYSTKSGLKIIPEVEITRTEQRGSGANTELWVTVSNSSEYPVFVDKSVIFGASQELDYPLPPGGQRDFAIYRGHERRDGAYKYAELYYRDEGTGDYFCATHMIQYEHKSDGAYEIGDLRLIRPIKDV